MMRRAAVFLSVLLLAATVWRANATSSSGESFVGATAVMVYSDGTVEVSQVVLPMNASSVTLALLSSSVGDILAVGDGGAAIPYQISGGNITLSTFGVSNGTLVYDTDTLTSKQGSTWDLNFDSPYNLTLVLPFQSTVLYLSGTPGSFSIIDGRPNLSLSAGPWEVSYGLSFPSPTSTTSVNSSSSTATTSSTQGVTTSSSSTAGSSPESPPVALSLGLAIVAVAVAAAGLLLFIRRSKSPKGSGLRPEDKEVLTFIREKGGSVNEVEIRERFSLPRTSAWRQAKRLEKLGWVRITKVGKQNQIELVSRPEPES